MARGDILWVKRALLRTLLLTFFFTAGSAAILVVFGQTIIDLWVGDTVHASYWLLIGLATWTLLTGLGSTVAIFLNGVSVLRFQAVCTILMSVTALGLKIVFAGWWGVAGVPWALVIAYAVFVVVPFVVYVPRLLRRLDSRSGGSSRLVWSDITAAEDPPLT
jgi:Na+-driven multidrug efflux pump